jgi:3-hydroxyisobutyrate dehydrogenase-like beta-hydroxyacid dehydrogenase
VPLPLTAVTSQVYELARRVGLANKDYTRIYRFPERP